MTALDEIAALVRREAGIALPASRRAALRAAVNRAAPGLDPGAFVRAAADRRRGGALVSRLIDEVTVQETAFVRDRAQFDAIDWNGLLRTGGAPGRRAIRVWSAGCASGEEAYTLALLAAESLTPSPGPVRPPVDVLGTDISGAALETAATARYRERAVRGLQPRLRQRYLIAQADGSYLVGEGLRRLVRFRSHNLARDQVPPPGEAGFDLVACRNVLIYFEERIARAVIESLRRSLRPGGMLLLGAADSLQRTAGPPSPPPPRGRPAARSPRRPLGRGRVPPREQRLAAALDAAGSGDREGARARVASLLAVDPFDADAHFIDGLIALEAGRPAVAAAALRRALCADAGFGLAAFTLGRAYDALGDPQAARRSYELALRTLDPEDDRHGQLLQQVDLGDIAAACRARLRGPPARGSPHGQYHLL